jgi:hypothetical protein
MDEAEWLKCNVCWELLTFLRGRTSKRKLRLIAVACCRQVLNRITDQRCRKAVEVAELFADDLASEGELSTAEDNAVAAAADVENAGTGMSSDFGFLPYGEGIDTRAYAGCVAAAHAAATDDPHISCDYAVDIQEEAPAISQMILLRDIFANPFRPVSIQPAWLTPTVVSLASVAYEERNLPSGELDNSRLAVLADALEDAGCANADILGHLRSAGPHVRGYLISVG